MTPFLETHELTKTYPGVLAAQSVSLQIDAGEVIGFVGKNGAGKSTIVRMLAGVTSPDKGTVKIDGCAVELNAPADATKHGLFFVHQELSDIPELSVAENISLGLGFPKRKGLIDWPALAARARHALKQLSHEEILPFVKVASLTIAQRRIVMIARALVEKARLIVLDEPSASLTDKEIDKLHGVVRMLSQEGVAVLYVSHRLQEILSLTTKILVMRDGHLVATHRTADLSEDDLIAEITGKTARPIEERVANAPNRSRTPVLEVRSLMPRGASSAFDFVLYPGEVLGLAGLAGAGRTELMRAVIGADSALNGTVLIDGKQVKNLTPKTALANGIALVSEDRRHEGGIFAFSILRNISLSSLSKHRLHKWLPIPSVASEKSEADKLIERLAIRTPGSEQMIGNLSGGNQQKVLLARALASNARILILDEPTHGIDVGAKEEIYGLVADLAAQGKSVIFVSSEFNEVLRVSDRIMILREGAHVETIHNGNLDEQTLLEHCYG